MVRHEGWMPLKISKWLKTSKLKQMPLGKAEWPWQLQESSVQQHADRDCGQGGWPNFCKGKGDKKWPSEPPESQSMQQAEMMTQWATWDAQQARNNGPVSRPKQTASTKGKNQNGPWSHLSTWPWKAPSPGLINNSRKQRRTFLPHLLRLCWSDCYLRRNRRQQALTMSLRTNVAW